MKRSEQETTVAYAAADDVVRIYSCIPADIRALKKRNNITVLDEGEYEDGNPYAHFEIPKAKFNISMAVRSGREMSDEQKQAASDRLAKARAAKAGE